MKNALALFLMLLSISALSQKAVMDIHGLLVNAATGNQYSNATTFGGGIGLNFFINDFISAGVEADYFGFTYSGDDSVVNVIPGQATLLGHWNITESFNFYAGLGAGLFWQRYKNGFELSETSLIWGITPRVGLNYEFSQDVFLTSCLKYNLIGQGISPNDAGDLLIFSIGLGYNINSDF